MLEAGFDDAHLLAAGPSAIAILQGLAKVNSFQGVLRILQAVAR
jgi:hypothetical protein